MAASNSSSTLKFVVLAIVVVIGSALGGYFLVGAGRQSDGGNAVAVNQQATSSTPPSATVEQARPAQGQVAGGDYTSPTSPRIVIREEKTPTAPDTAKIAAPDKPSAPSDAEATQEAAAPSPSSAPDTSSVGTVPSPVTGDATTPATSSQSSDPDYEQTANAPDTEAIPTNGATPGAAGHAQFRVEVGSFTQSMSARSLADVLRNRGYSTTTVTERDADKTVYHVQAGAFRTRAAADRATVELQREGFPAFVSAISQ